MKWKLWGLLKTCDTMRMKLPLAGVMIWLVVVDTGWRGGWTSFSGMGEEVEEHKNFRQGKEASLMVSIDGSHIVSDSTLKSWRLPVKKNHWPLCSRICWPRLKSRLNYDGKTILMLSTGALLVQLVRFKLKSWLWTNLKSNQCSSYNPQNLKTFFEKQAEV